MNAILDFLRTRRSVAPRLVSEPGPSEADLEAILTVAARVPDHGRLVPWRFIVIEGETRLRLGETIAAAFQSDEPEADASRVETERLKLARAPVVIAVVSRAKPHVKIPEWEQLLSAGAVCMNLLHAAHALGYGASWLTDWFAFDRRVLDAMGLEPHERLAGFIHIGRPAEVPADRPRPDLPSIITRL